MAELERRVLTSGLKFLRRSKKWKKRSEEDKPEEKQEEEENQDEGDKTEEEKEDGDEKEEGEDEQDEKTDRENSIGTIEGYAAVFYSEGDAGTQYELWSEPRFRAVEQVAAGAFSRAINEGDDCRSLFNHEPDQVLGRTSSGTCRLSEDERGLRYETDLPDTTVGRDVAELIDRGDVTGSSFGFVVEQESWRETEGKDGSLLAVRTIESVRLLDVGPVTYPAYAGTSAGVRSLQAPVRAIGSIEKARSSYKKWKESRMSVQAKIAAVRARAVQVGASQD